MMFTGKAVLLLSFNLLLTCLPFIDHIRVGPSFTDDVKRKVYVSLENVYLIPYSVLLSRRL